MHPRHASRVPLEGGDTCSPAKPVLRYPLIKPSRAPGSALAVFGLLGGLAVAPLPALAQHRIITLSPSLTEAVCALGHCAELVGTDRYSSWPGNVARLPKVGGLQDAQIESIVALRPDMVLLGPRSRAGERLTQLGVPVQVFDARTHADLKRMLLALGQSLGETARGGVAARSHGVRGGWHRPHRRQRQELHRRNRGAPGPRQHRER